MGWGSGKKQVPRDARNDSLRAFRLVAEVWRWLGDSALLWVEAGSMAVRRRVVGAGRAGCKVGVIHAADSSGAPKARAVNPSGSRNALVVRIPGWVGRGSLGWS